jgi:hypothetical protein
MVGCWNENIYYNLTGQQVGLKAHLTEFFSSHPPTLFLPPPAFPFLPSEKSTPERRNRINVEN